VNGVGWRHRVHRGRSPRDVGRWPPSALRRRPSAAVAGEFGLAAILLDPRAEGPTARTRRIEAAKRTDTSNPPPGALTTPVTSESSNPDSTRVTSPISGPPSPDSCHCQTREAPTRVRGPSHHSTCPINRVEPPNPRHFAPTTSIDSSRTVAGGFST